VARAELDSHPPILAPGQPARSAWALPRLAELPLSLLTLLLLACFVRAAGLPVVQGTMGRDEARLALAAQGILQHGLPILPDGFLYTRGLLPAYLNAASITVFGATDQAARLSDLLFSTLLVAAVYRLGRLAGGHRPAVIAAAIVAFSPPLVLQAREAWLYSSFLLWLTLALGWLVRDAAGDRLRAGLAAAATLFSHELAVLLVPVAFLLDAGRWWEARRLRQRGSPSARPWPAAWRSLLLFWALLLVSVAAMALLSLLLRSPTLAGATGEVREYLRFTADLRGLDMTLDILGSWHPWLLPIAVLGLPLSRAGWRALLAGRGIMPCLLMALAVILFNSFGLVRRGESRYMLAAIPFLAVVAAVALDRAGPGIVAALVGRTRLGAARHVVRMVLLITLLALCLDPGRLLAEAQSRAVATTWVQGMAGRSPDDLIVSFAPTLTTHYLGRTDYWLRSEGFAKYVWASQRPLRDVHTGATVLRTPAEVDQLLLQPNAGRTIWVVLAGEPGTETSRGMRELAAYLAQLAVETRYPADGRVVLRIER
jgi:4-amino-4-deoxy-L-arabinose transferase-like glycosyltransferase